VQVPTTLLAQTDSSIGGKTGVDLGGIKNMVGAFYMPSLVYINTSTLDSLDDRQYFAGFAEVMKHGLIKDQNFYTWLIDNMYEICDKESDVVGEMVTRSLSIKKQVVEKDPTEKGDRALLNFGHTLGHAIEKHMDFKMVHGECVALGCIAAAFISWKRGLLSMEEYYEIRDMFVPFNLPISIENIDKDAVLDLTKSDKKADSDKIKFILLKKIGKAFIDETVTRDEMSAALDELIYVENND
jgi:3-dehydroquinate synthase